MNNRPLLAATVTALFVVASFNGVADDKKDHKSMQMMEHCDCVSPEEVEKAKTQEDHEAIAKRFDAEAKTFDAQAARHEELARHYAFGHGTPPRGNATSLAQHCKNLTKNLKASAQEAREMAQLHRQLGQSLAK